MTANCFSVPRVKVLTEGMPAEGFDVTEGRVAADAEQPPDDTRHMIMVDMEVCPAPAGAGIGAGYFRNLPAYRTPAPLLGNKSSKVFAGDTVLSPQPLLTSFVSHSSVVETGALMRVPAETAVRPTELAWLPDMEVSMRALNLADSACDRAFILDGSASPLPGESRPVFRLAEAEPSLVTTGTPSVHDRGPLRWLSTNGTGMGWHVFILPDLGLPKLQVLDD